MKKNSLFNVKPELAKEWNFRKNKGQNPYNISYGSNLIVWWLCEEGHEWKAKVKSRLNGFNSCKECKYNEILEEFKKIAIAKEGWCISTTYKTNRKLKFRCKFNHEWDARPSEIKNNNTWCPICSSNKRYSLSDMKDIAAKRGGQCLSKEYFNVHSKLEWKCADGHTWFAKPNNIISSDSWCPECNSFLSERKCRYIFEVILDCKFKKNRKMLDGLELDGYNNSLNLAFEYQGKQHTQLHTLFTKTQKDLDERIETDSFKIKKCKELGVNLIVIPTDESITDSRLLSYIVKELKRIGIEVGSHMENFKFEDFYKNLSIIKDLQVIAKERGGKCLSSTYVNKNNKMNWECDLGHVWQATPHHIKFGSWCPECSGNQKLGIQKMHQLAADKNGKCLSTEYTNVDTALLWECKSKHKFIEKPRAIIYHGTWCPDCSRRTKWNLEKVKLLAEKKGGKCLSNHYINYDSTKYVWNCRYGHEWEATLASVKLHWCPECANNKKKRIEDMQALAKVYNGICLSIEVKNNKDLLKWRCNKGHEFTKRPNDIVSKQSWCGKCNKIEKKIDRLN